MLEFLGPSPLLGSGLSPLPGPPTLRGFLLWWHVSEKASRPGRGGH